MKNFSRTDGFEKSRPSSPSKTHSNSPVIKKNRFESPKKTSKEHSELLLTKLKKNRFDQIFSELLPNTKGLITKETIYKSKLETKVKSILRPILQKIDQDDESLNQPEFCSQMEGLLKSITVAEKAELLKTHKKIENSQGKSSRCVSSGSLVKSLQKTMNGCNSKQGLKSLDPLRSSISRLKSSVN
jgi:hypothetical protein